MYKYRIKLLIHDLELAEKLLSEFSGGYSGEFISAEEFHFALCNRIERLKLKDYKVINDLWIWFAPTCQWDNFVGKVGLKLGNKKFDQIDRLKE
jgi:hypothetical protein